MATSKFEWDYERLRGMYESGMSTIAIGQALGRDQRLVRYHLRRAGVAIRKIGESRIVTVDTTFAVARAQIAAEHQAGASVRFLQKKHQGKGWFQKIADLCRALPARETTNAKRRPEITPELRRKLSASSKAQWQRMTKQERSALREASIKAKLGEKNVNYGRVWSTQGRGKRTPGVDFAGSPVVFRSTWEKAFADYLNAQGTPWLYEPEAIKCGSLGTYTPDFYVEPWECFVEVKGWLAPKARQKIEWFRRNDPRPLVLATKEVLRRQYGVEVN